MLEKGYRNVCVFVPEALHRQVKVYAAEQGKSLKEILTEALKLMVNDQLKPESVR